MVGSGNRVLGFVFAPKGISSQRPLGRNEFLRGVGKGLYTSGKCVNRTLFRGLFLGNVRLIAGIGGGVEGSLVDVTSGVLLEGETLVRAIGSRLGGVTRVRRSERHSFDGFVTGSLSTVTTCYFFRGGPTVSMGFIGSKRLTVF